MATERTIETKNYSIILNCNGDKSRGYFEHHVYGDERGGGLWFERKELIDYDGMSYLPKQVMEALKAAGYDVSWAEDDPAA